MRSEERSRVITALRHSLKLDRVSKRYGDVLAVDDVTLNIQRGQFVTLLGPSGSGKTTLLMAIAGFVEPSGGEILVDGQAISMLPPERRDFGMVFQGYALFPHLSVFDNVAFPLKVRGRPAAEIRQRVGQMLELVQLQALADRRPRQLSGGQAQRVALARALAFEPKLLLLDEPLSALDKKLRAELQTELKDLHRRVGLTFIYVTHDQEEALSMSDSIAILRGGRLTQFGPPGDLYERPASRFVADFLGKSNFISGTIVDPGADPGAERFVLACGEARFVQAGDGRVRKAGEGVLIALRPEKVELSETRGETDNAVAGTIVDVSYYGEAFRLVVEAEDLPPDQRRIMVSVPVWRSQLTPEPGRRVVLGWDADAAVPVVPD